MKTIKPRLEKLKSKIEDNINHRKIYYADRTGKWQMSNKGYAYNNVTNDLISTANHITEAIKSIDEFLEKKVSKTK